MISKELVVQGASQINKERNVCRVLWEWGGEVPGLPVLPGGGMGSGVGETLHRGGSVEPEIETVIHPTDKKRRKMIDCRDTYQGSGIWEMW